VALVSAVGAGLGCVLVAVRMLFALGRDGALPHRLATVHPRYHTPAVAIVSYAAIVATLAVSSTFAQLVVLANVSGLLLYLMCVAASYELQRRDVRMAGAPFKLPGGILLPLVAGAGIVWLVAQATAREFKIEASVLVVAGAYYLVRRKSIRPPLASSSPSSA